MRDVRHPCCLALTHEVICGEGKYFQKRSDIYVSFYHCLGAGKRSYHIVRGEQVVWY